MSEPWKIDAAIYDRDWCERHAHLTGPELGALMGVTRTTALNRLRRLGVAHGDFCRDCDTCPRERACSFEVWSHWAALCEVADDAGELEACYERQRATRVAGLTIERGEAGT